MQNNLNIKIPEYIHHGFDKYKYILLVCLVGILLAMLPVGKESKDLPKSLDSDIPQVDELALNLEKALSNIEGVGRVKVVLTLKSGFESVYAYDMQKNEASQGVENISENSTTTMVITSSGSAGQSPVVVKVNAPQYYGAIIICDGGDSGIIKLELTQAITSLTGITSDNITIFKMKK